MGKYLLTLLLFVSLRVAANCETQPMVFLLLEKEGPESVLATLRTEKAPLNYQWLMRLRLDSGEMKNYSKAVRNSKTLPALLTEPVCAKELLEALKDPTKTATPIFPLKASFVTNEDHEEPSIVAKSVVTKSQVSLQREEFTTVLIRQLDGPSAYLKGEGSLFNPARECLRNSLLKNVPVPETIHSFVILKELNPKTVLAAHYIDYAPQNFQTILKIKLSPAEMKLYREATKDSKTLPLFQTRVKTKTGGFQDSYFCVENIRKQKAASQFRVSGTIYKDSSLESYKLGQPMGAWDVSSEDIEVLVNRRLEDLLNPADVAAEAEKASVKK